MKKKEYTKPAVKLVEWKFSEAVCQTVTTNSPCIKIVGDSGGTTRIDHRGSWSQGSIKWNDFPNTGN